MYCRITKENGNDLQLNYLICKVLELIDVLSTASIRLLLSNTPEANNRISSIFHIAQHLFLSLHS